MPESAVAGVLATSAGMGAGPYLAVAFGVFVLVYVWLDQRARAAQDEEHRVAVAQAYELLRDQNHKRVQEVGELMHCTRDGVNSAVVAIRETNAELIRGFAEAIREIKPVIQKSTAAVARAELVMDAIASRPNGHA